MPFMCPRNNTLTLEMKHSVSVKPKRETSKDELVQTFACSACDFRGLGLYIEPYAHDANHDVYAIDGDSFLYLDRLLAQADHNTDALREVEALHHASYQDGPVRVDWRSGFRPGM